SIATVLMSAWIPAPPPESETAMIRMRAVAAIERALVPPSGAKFSMRTLLSLRRQIPRKRSRGGPNSLADVVDDAVDHRRIVALRHHPDQRLGARLADDEAAAALELGLGGG